MGKPWLTSSETAQILGVSVRTLRYWRFTNTGPDYKQNTPRGPVLYSTVSVQRFLAKTLTRAESGNADGE